MGKSNEQNISKENIAETKGIKMISYPRKYQRGGGVCILADMTKVDILEVVTANPDNVEAIFRVVKHLLK